MLLGLGKRFFGLSPTLVKCYKFLSLEDSRIVLSKTKTLAALFRCIERSKTFEALFNFFLLCSGYE